MLISVLTYNDKYGYIFEAIRNIVMPIFVMEYLLRMYAYSYLDEYKGFKGKIKYMTTPFAIIDLLAILPYLLTNFGFNGSFIRSLRLLRVFRLLRIKKYVVFIQLMKKILNNIKEEVAVLLFFTFIMLIILSFIMYDIEHRAQPEVLRIFSKQCGGP
jgi:voltage-gated potassium channel